MNLCFESEIQYEYMFCSIADNNGFVEKKIRIVAYWFVDISYSMNESKGSYMNVTAEKADSLFQISVKRSILLFYNISDSDHEHLYKTLI